MATCNIATLIQQACENKFTCIQDEKTARAIIMQLLCNLSNEPASQSGTGSPEGVVTAIPGSTYVDVSNGNLWVKQTGTGNTGWTNKG